MKKIVSVALFGEQYEKYAVYLPAFVLGALNVFPRAQGWRVVVHVSGAAAHASHVLFLLRLYEHDLVDVVWMPELPLAKSMLQRLSPVWTADADFVFCRDLDSPPMPRDRAACEEFIATAVEKKCSLHTIHDSDQHIGIMGGLCGVHASSFKEVTGLRSLGQLCMAAEPGVPWDDHGVDQHVLNFLFLCAGGPRLFEHRYAGWHKGPRRKKPREAGKYACGGVSSPVPDAFRGVPGFCVEEVEPGLFQEKADLLGGHLGCAGYDYAAAVKFWREHGDPKIAAKTFYERTS